jgi:hypothetical protein
VKWFEFVEIPTFMICLSMLFSSALARRGVLCALCAVSSSIVQGAQAEPKPSGLSSLATVLRAQQSYHLEKHIFASKISQLDVRLDDTNAYRYSILKADAKHMIAKSIPKKLGQNSYAAGAFFSKGDDFTQILCESDGFSQSIASPYFQKGAWNCGRYSHLVLRMP